MGWQEVVLYQDNIVEDCVIKKDTFEGSFVDIVHTVDRYQQEADIAQ